MHENYKIKTITCNRGELNKVVKDLIKDKIILEMKLTGSNDKRFVCIVYKDEEEKNNDRKRIKRKT